MIDGKFSVLIDMAVLIFINQELRHFRFGIAHTCGPQSHAKHQESRNYTISILSETIGQSLFGLLLQTSQVSREINCFPETLLQLLTFSLTFSV